MLGSAVEELLRESGRDFIASDKEVDITDTNEVDDYLRRYCPSGGLQWIINCAAYTAVDRAEDEPAAAAKLNVVGPKNLARAAERRDATLIHVSTDYVFDGKNPEGYREDDPQGAISIYGRTKWAGEVAIGRSGAAHYIVRTAWLFGEHGPNFVATMLSLFEAGKAVRVVNDQWGSPTYAGDLAEALVGLTETGSDAGMPPRRDAASGAKAHPATGIYHFTNGGRISWYDFACEIHRQAREMGLCSGASTIEPVPSSSYPTRAARPHYSFLHTEKIKQALDRDIRHYTSALHSYLEAVKKEGKKS